MLLNALLSTLIMFTPQAISDSQKSHEKQSNEAEVILYDGLASPAANNMLAITLCGYVYEPLEQRSARQSLIRGIIVEALELDEPDELPEGRFPDKVDLNTIQRNISDRIRFFLTDGESGESVIVGNEKFRHQMPQSDNGYFASAFSIPRNVQNTPVQIRSLSHSRQTEEPAVIHDFSDRSLIVISDIDDTIKISNVGNREEMLRSTFAYPTQQVPGMSALYRSIATRFKAGFCYVSGSPWQLYPMLKSFISEQGFPQGPLFLKTLDFSGRNTLDFLLADQTYYKMSTIDRLYQRFPDADFILIGDSSEKDPEIYTTLAGKYSPRTRLILIRDPQAESETSKLRYAALFKQLGGGTRLIVFSSQPPLPEKLEEWYPGLLSRPAYSERR